MDSKKEGQQTPQYEPEKWKGEEQITLSANLLQHSGPDVQEQCRVLDLLGKINYRILSGNRVYIEVGGIVYRTLYGGYWRSVFTGIEHYLLRCEQVSGEAWAGNSSSAVDLPITYSKEGWTASGHSLSFILNRDFSETPQTLIDRLRQAKSQAKQKFVSRRFDAFCA